MITLSIDENLIFIINVLDQTVDELKSNIIKLKSFINVKKENLLLKKIYKYISDLEKSEGTKLKSQLTSDRSAESNYYSSLSFDKFFANPNDITNDNRKTNDKTESFRSCTSMSSLESMIFGLTGFCTSSNTNQGTNELNLSKYHGPREQIEQIDNNVSTVENDDEPEIPGCQTFTRLNNFNSTNQTKPSKSVSFCTINEANSLVLSGDDSGFYSEYDDNLANINIIPDCVMLNSVFQKEKAFLNEFISVCEESINIFNQIINDTNKFKFYLKTELKDIITRYNLRDKHWNKARANLIKNCNHLQSCLGNSKPPYKIEGDIPGIVNEPGVKSILAYIRYINSEREWQRIMIKAKGFIMQLEKSFIKLFIDFVNHFNANIYTPSCKVLELFSTLSQHNDFCSPNSTFSNDIYNTSQIKTLSQQYIKKCSKLRKLRGSLTKYFILRYEKLEMDPNFGSTMPQFLVAGVDISFFFFAMQTYYKLNKMNMSEYRKKTFRSAITSPKLSYSNSSGVINVTSNTNKQLNSIVMELLTFHKFSPVPFDKAFADTLRLFRRGIPDDITDFLNQIKQLDELTEKKDSEPDDSDTDEGEFMNNNTMDSFETEYNVDHDERNSGIRLLDKWIDPNFYNITNNKTMDRLKEYSRSYKFQAEARLCYHNSDLNMNFEKGDIVKVYEPVGDIWWGSYNDVDGPFPAKCLETRWIVGLYVDYEKETELDAYITAPNDDIIYPNDVKEIGISLFDKFNIPETCIGSFSCALHKKILLQGKLLISKSYLVFSSHFNENTLFGESTIQTIPITSIKRVKKGSKRIPSQSIEVDCLQNVYIFSSFINRNKVINLINLLIRLKSPQEDTNKLQLIYDPLPINLKLTIPDELRKYELFKEGYNQLEILVFCLTTPMPLEDVFNLLFDLSQPPHRSVRESMQYDNFFYSIDDGEKVEAIQDSDGLKINYPTIFPSVTKRTLFYSIQIKQNSLNQMLGVPTTGDVTEAITTYFIDDSNILIESDTKVSGVPLSNSFHNTWHILLKKQGTITSMTGSCQVFIDHWIPFSNKVLNEAQNSIKSALKCFADTSYQIMAT